MIGHREPEWELAPLFDGAKPNPPLSPAPSQDDDALGFATFHAENPGVYASLRDLALAQVEAGITHGGIAQLYEVLRYRASLSTTGGDFKLNNSHRAHYARLLMDREPRLRGFFEIRASVADGGTR